MLRKDRRGTATAILLGLALVLVMAASVDAATYLPLSDRDLAARAPVVVRAVVQQSSVRVEDVDGKALPFTLVTVKPTEFLKGSGDPESMRVRLPGGRVGDKSWWIPGTPVMVPGSEVLLFLESRSAPSDAYDLVEFALGHFAILRDEMGRRFAFRPAFEPAEDLYLGLLAPGPGAMVHKRAAFLREADSLFASLRAPAKDATAKDIVLAAPTGNLVGRPVDGHSGMHPKWVNVNGTEPGTLFKWFWPTDSPNGVVSTSGTQSLLSDGTDGTADVAAMVAQWHGVAAADVRYTSGSGGNVIVSLDVPSVSSGWSAPLACDAGGVVGLGGPGLSSFEGSFKGDSDYYAPDSGNVWVRARTGSAGCYSSTAFKNTVLHELGHTLGLGHPDQAASIHSTACPFATCTAVMRSSLTGATTPQGDDIAGIQWYYGTGVAACTYAISPVDLSNVAAGGATPSITIITAGTCALPTMSYQPWVAIGGIVRSSGSSTVQLQIASNAGSPPRATSLLIADRLFLVTQLGP